MRWLKNPMANAVYVALITATQLKDLGQGVEVRRK